MKAGKVFVEVGFDAASRRITLEGQQIGEPIEILSRVNAEGFDYQTEAYKTCSPHWNPQNVGLDDLRRNLVKFVDLCGVLNIYYKMLLRGKSPDQYDMTVPTEGESVGGHGGAIPPNEIDLVHGILGAATEVGELVEVLIDMLDGKKPDRVNAVEEVGDMRWFLNLVLRWAGCTDLQCERLNIDKLHGRHGSAFDIFRDANRDLARERTGLEKGVEQPAPLLEAAESAPKAASRRFMKQSDE